MATSERDIRVALASVVKAAVPLAVVYNRWILNLEPGQWAGLLRSPEDGDRVRSWIMSRRAISQTPVGNNCVRPVWTYAIWGFYGYSTGDDSSSSEDGFSADVDAVCSAIASNTLPEAIARNDQVQFNSLVIMSFGGELVHVAQGSLVITPCLH